MMASQGTPKGGLSEIAERAYPQGADYTLVCYRNTAGSLGDDSVAADLVQPSEANGYAPILLNGTWTVVDGVATYEHSGGGHPTWFATGAWDSPVTGVAIIYGARIVHFKDLPAGQFPSGFIAGAGKKLRVSINNVAGP